MSAIESAGNANWRKTLQQNKIRTYYVIISYLLIYVAIGLIIDAFFQVRNYPNASLSEIFQGLVTLQIPPIATAITLIIAIVSIWVTFMFHDKLMLLGTEYHEITPTSNTSTEKQQLYNVVEEMKISAGLKFMPKVFIIEADYMNAFASGYSEKSAMVAITRGLMQKLNRSELQAVMAHELSHIRHMDIKLTLFASVLSNLILMMIDMLFYGVLFGGGGDREDRGRNQLTIIIVILRMVLPFLTLLLMLYLSRTREYMADAGSVELMRDNEPLANALMKINQDHQNNAQVYGAQYRQTPHENVRREAYIFDPIMAGIEPTSSMSDMFSTHPGIEKRLAALGFKQRSVVK
jgi:heat shock protein HtpX